MISLRVGPNVKWVVRRYIFCTVQSQIIVADSIQDFKTNHSSFMHTLAFALLPKESKYSFAQLYAAFVDNKTPVPSTNVVPVCVSVTIDVSDSKNVSDFVTKLVRDNTEQARRNALVNETLSRDDLIDVKDFLAMT